MHLGIDFGTSSTTAVLTGEDGAVTPLLFDGSPLLPSAVHLDAASGVLAVGGAAVRGGTADPDRYEPNPKLRAADVAVTLGGTGVPVEHLFAAVLWAVHAEALRATGGVPPLEVALTHPVLWDAHHRGTLLTAASMAGLPAARLVPSPVAVACTLLGRLRVPLAEGQCLVVYELGAGPFEATVVRSTAAGPQVVAAAGLAGTGGLDVDAAIAAHLLAVAPAGARLDPGQRRWLTEQARLAKELLGAGTPAVVPVAGRGEVTLTPEDLDRVATPLVRPTAELTLRVMRDAGVDARSVAGVYLAGGGTRMPLVATLLHRVVGIPPVAADQPELLAAEGSVAVLAAPHPPAAPPHPHTVPARSVPDGDGAGPDGAGPDGAGPDGGDGGHLWHWLPERAAVISGRTWLDAPFHPLQLGLPSGHGWTIRARFAEPEHTVFLSRGGGPLLFRSVDGLAAYLLRDGDHELAELDGWPAARDLFVSLVREAGDEDEVDLDLVQYNLGFPPQQWMPDLLAAARDVAVDLAEAYDLHDIIALLADGSLLDGVDDLLRDAERALVGRSARRRLDAVDADAVRWDWHAIVTRLDGIAAWAD
ncbi:Hsp70 family protein [Dactylosporangium siamense]|uniref:Hsp70 protein n=1 Tax=Dactylosporangium siamense TaxID=685454 RepID=A0A919UGH2_9ACTN|nr:Hsp70 family protein [Dactylosporangium siamense]GIG51296.1 hypothetical protein Dsi01nite_093370 [Dactylosporangium siamense]